MQCVHRFRGRSYTSAPATGFTWRPLQRPAPTASFPKSAAACPAHGIIDHEFGTVDVNAEVLSVKPYTFADNSFWNYFVPRFHLGGDVNTGGKTSQIYAGATWNFPIYQRLFGELTFGGRSE